MIFVSLSGCAAVKDLRAKKESRESLVRAQRLFEQGEYEGSLKENQKVLAFSNDVPPGDEALFHTAIIYAHVGYPKRDYKKSLDLFMRLVKKFPRSPWTKQAEIWIGILRENERLYREVEELNQTLKKSKEVDIEINKKKKELAQ